MKRLSLFLLAGMLTVLFVRTQSPKSFAHELTLSAAHPATALANADPQQKNQYFTGHIAQTNGMYVLIDDGNRITYQLDRQEKAKPLNGKNVKVTGSLDTSNNTIYVADITEI